jgi:hypothetical protein
MSLQKNLWQITVLLLTTVYLFCPTKKEAFSFLLHYQNGLTYNITVPKIRGCSKNETTIRTLLNSICSVTGIDTRELRVRLCLRRMKSIENGVPSYDASYKYYSLNYQHYAHSRIKDDQSIPCLQNGSHINIQQDEQVLIAIPSGNDRAEDYHNLLEHYTQHVILESNHIKIDDAEKTLASYAREHFVNRNMTFICSHCKQDIPGTQKISQLACVKIDPSRWQACKMLDRPIEVRHVIPERARIITDPHATGYSNNLNDRGAASHQSATHPLHSLLAFASQRVQLYYQSRYATLIVAGATGTLLGYAAFRTRMRLWTMFVR